MKSFEQRLTRNGFLRVSSRENTYVYFKNDFTNKCSKFVEIKNGYEDLIVNGESKCAEKQATSNNNTTNSNELPSTLATVTVEVNRENWDDNNDTNYDDDEDYAATVSAAVAVNMELNDQHQPLPNLTRALPTYPCHLSVIVDGEIVCPYIYDFPKGNLFQGNLTNNFTPL